ncbi:hypothetical protein [Andreprevotia chitinilytica]|uniref:hypothetical protein n=1 Tax=Andreprevotia chitinilytica TaxID=396808 RepID=UPI0006893A44|nr:hypothetical protein [Andreprevotia chitinilytica]
MNMAADTAVAGLNDSTHEGVRESGWTLDWAHGEAHIQALGGMLGPVHFRLPDGRNFQPFYVAPWADDPALPPLLRRMRGEWPCVPFTRPDVPAGLPAGWRAQPTLPDDIHGPGSNQPWHLICRSESHVVLGIDYPDNHAIRSLRREIRADPASACLHIKLTIEPRRATVMPVALHPTFRLPAGSGSGLQLEPGAFRAAHTYPVQFEDGVSTLLPNSSSGNLQMLPGNDGPVDLSRLPLPNQTEELVQLQDCDGVFGLLYRDEGVRVTLRWDARRLPDAVLWVSNGGRAHAPWLGRNFALGVEPVCGVFELGGVATPPADHPLATRKGLLLRAGIPVEIAYSVGVAPA